MYQSVPSSPSQAVQSKRQKYTVLIDTDIGDDIDDALALALALHSPEIELRGVTTVFGDTQRRAQLTSHLLYVFGHQDIPVAVGIGTPLQPRHHPSGVPQAAVLGDNTFNPEAFSPLSGPELIVQTALNHDRQLTVLCIGPLTNVALALLIEPRINTAIRSIVMMGGSSGIPLPEWNVRNDVRATQIVLSSGIPVTMLGLNVTTRCQLREKDIKQLRDNGSEQTKLLSQLLTIWQKHRPRWHPRLPYLHDPLTIAALCVPELLRFKDMEVQVLAHGPFKGYMVPRVLGGSSVYAAVGVRAKEAREWVMQRLLRE